MMELDGDAKVSPTVILVVIIEDDHAKVRY